MIDAPPQTAEVREVDVNRRVLAIIHQLENPTNSRKPGKKGELGPYQFLRTTWEHLSHLPFTPEYVCDPDISYAVAVLHLAEIRLALRRADRVEMPSALAACWNGGTTRFISNTVPLSTSDYVLRFSHLYYGK